MIATPKSILDELKRLEKLSRQTMSPTEREVYEAAEDKLTERMKLFSATIARQQRAENELILKGQHEGCRQLQAWHDLVNANAHF